MELDEEVLDSVFDGCTAGGDELPINRYDFA
jgi:hypothetical protein